MLVSFFMSSTIYVGVYTCIYVFTCLYMRKGKRCNILQLAYFIFACLKESCVSEVAEGRVTVGSTALELGECAACY